MAEIREIAHFATSARYRNLLDMSHTHIFPFWKQIKDNSLVKIFFNVFENHYSTRVYISSEN